MLDIALLRKTVEWAEDEHRKAKADKFYEPEHYQNSWVSTKQNIVQYEVINTAEGEQVYVPACGTTYCIAGKIVLEHDGLKKLIEINEQLDGETDAVAMRAAEILGVNWRDVWNDESTGSLFSGHNTVTEVRQHAQALAAYYDEEL